MNINNFAKLILTTVFLIPAASLATAQNGVQTRSVMSDDFANKRPAAVRTKSTARPRPLSYKRVRAEKSPIKPVPGTKPPPPPPKTEKFTELGITTWRLRPPQKGESGYMFSVKDDKGVETFQLAERVGTETVFKAGDKVRFAIESSVAGYLYVFDRETHADGSFGEPVLIFPESLDEDNAVGPGLIADIPDQRSDQPYYDMTPKKADYNGELLTVILSPRPLTKLVVDADGKLLNADALGELEFSSDVEIFTRDDTNDRIYTATESKAACGVKTRELTRTKTSGKPCGSNATMLTPDEPLPQSLYRIKGVPGQAAVAFVKLSVK